MKTRTYNTFKQIGSPTDDPKGNAILGNVEEFIRTMPEFVEAVLTAAEYLTNHGQAALGIELAETLAQTERVVEWKGGPDGQ